MSRVIHARLDVPTEQLLREIERRLGWNDSQVVYGRLLSRVEFPEHDRGDAGCRSGVAFAGA
jgi:hypothetical protein